MITFPDFLDLVTGNFKTTRWFLVIVAGQLGLQTLVKIMGCSRYNTCIHLKVTGEDWLSGAYCPGTIQDVGLPSYTKEGGFLREGGELGENFANNFYSFWRYIILIYIVYILSTIFW